MTKTRIFNRTPGGLSIPDLGVRLDGPKSFVDVLTDTASCSRDLAAALRSRWVSTRLMPPERPMPVWPFIPELPPRTRVPALAPPAAESVSEALLRSINEKLSELMKRPSPAAPEVVAAHVRRVASMPSVPAGLPGGGNLPGPGASSHPVFIPSSIVPKDEAADVEIKTITKELDSQGLDEGVSALRNLRGKK